ncbi:MAG: 6-carboxytetrahydropterin synthase [Holophagae bacterium]|jgi:6-pyruvoyltetrahydropterin/6-carboxytetrahydropterin synthase
MATTVSVKVYFEAAHRLHNTERSDEWNQQVFGKCNNLYGHGHNYVLEASVRGEVDPDSGYLIDMKDLKDVLNRTVVDDVDHKHMNHEVPWLEGINPTAENLARIFFERVEPELPDGIELAELTVHETERNSASYSR